MHVHIDARRLDLHEQHPHRLPSGRQRRCEPAVDREVERAVTDVAAIDEEVERPRGGEAELRRGDDPVDPQPEPLLLHREEEGRDLGPQRGGDALLEVIRARRKHPHRPALVLQPEGDPRVGKGEA
jgi:hypothetical protein